MNNQLDLFDMPETAGVFVTPVIKEKVKKKKYDSGNIIQQLKKRRESCLKKANAISTEVSGNYTHKRGREAAHRSNNKTRLEKRAQFYTNLINAWDEDNVPELLKEVRNDADYDRCNSGYFPRTPDDDDGDWYKEEYPAKLKHCKKLGINNDEDAKEAERLVTQFSEIYISPEQQRKIDLQKKINEIRGVNIPGFFPTPDELIDRMIYISDLKDGNTILEPSAGIGSILDRVVSNLSYGNCKLYCCETQYSLQNILELKGYTIAAGDIFKVKDSEIPMDKFDTILMNPPFEKQQDIDHVKYCYDNFLKEGGNLVSVMSLSVKSHTSSKATEFRDFVDENGEWHEVEQGAFKSSFNPTGVSVCIVKLIK